MIISLLTVLHVVNCILLILVVLLQSGKGSDIGAVFGGGASQSLFGPTGGKTILSKITTVMAVVFMITSVLLATLPYTIGRTTSGLQEKLQKVEPQENLPASTQTTPEAKTIPAVGETTP